jgi:1-aminocyclopropane-1-carboxylate deaminase
MDALPSLQNLIIDIQPLKSRIADEHNISVDMLRLDAIHPIVSGNKLFKLTYFLEQAKNSTHKQIITFGGAYSNHLAATAFACSNAGLKSVGIVRGEKPEKLSHTLKLCLENKMYLEFISRSEYLHINTNNFTDELIKKFGSHILIPEGGFSKKGANGAALICNHYYLKNYSHVCCAIGTATTFAGLIKGSFREMIIGFSVLKNLLDVEERLRYLNVSSSKKYSIIPDYHFGGYAKKNSELISFMNSFYNNNKIPLDFVYTGKMMFGVHDLIAKNYFPQGSKILCIHTGGLQGNKSLPDIMLNF